MASDSASKIAIPDPPVDRITFPPGTIIGLTTYTLPTGEIHVVPRLSCWETLGCYVTCSGEDVTSWLLTEVLTGPSGHIKYFLGEKHAPHLMRLTAMGASGMRHGNVTFSYRPLGENQ